MNQRLQQFLAAENISQAQFADTIDVARASISHVLSGRNKPGYEFIKSISDHYPKLSMEWLITGKGKMYKETAVVTEIQNPQPTSQVTANTQFSQSLQKSSPEPDSGYKGADDYQGTLFSGDDDDYEDETPVSVKSERKTAEKKILKVIVFYDDGTYQELK